MKAPCDISHPRHRLLLPRLYEHGKKTRDDPRLNDRPRRGRKGGDTAFHQPSCVSKEQGQRSPVTDSNGRGNGLLSGFIVQELSFTFSPRTIQNHLKRENGEDDLPKYDSRDEVEKAERVHDVPQIGKIVHPVHVPLQHRGDREGA